MIIDKIVRVYVHVGKCKKLVYMVQVILMVSKAHPHSNLHVAPEALERVGYKSLISNCRIDFWAGWYKPPQLRYEILSQVPRNAAKSTSKQ